MINMMETMMILLLLSPNKCKDNPIYTDRDNPFPVGFRLI